VYNLAASAQKTKPANAPSALPMIK
jgi:hypothetical protein